MAGRFVRASKYRHVFGTAAKKEQCYDNLRISKNAWDTNLVKANPQYISVNWEASGGGAFAVIPINEKGRLPEIIPLFRGHTGPVLDTDWSPFDDSLIASASDDGKVFIWKVPENFSLYTDAEEPADVAPVSRLSRHMRKVGHVLFNPAAENVLASASGDYTVKIWDVNTGTPKLNLQHKEIVQSLSWSANGSMLVTTSRDKKLRVWDVRQEKPAHEVAGHAGAKNSRAVWMGEHDRIATTGFSRMSDRQLGLWDARSPNEPIGGFTLLDSQSGVCMPFWDDGTQCLYLAGKGDGNIRYYEYENDKFEFLNEYPSPAPQRGIAFMPKRGVSLKDNEVLRCFKTVNDSYIEPISFVVPRRSEMFQNDIYPPTTGLKPGTTTDEWFGGKTALPPKISLESVYEGRTPEEVPSEPKAPAATAPVQSPPPTKTEAPKPAPAAAPAPAPVPEASRGPPPSMNDNKASLASQASKFADKDEESSDGDMSDFEEVSKPIERPFAAASRQEEQTPSSVAYTPKSTPSLTDDQAQTKPLPSSSKAPVVTSAESQPATASPASKTPSAATAPPSQPTSSAAGAASGLKDVLQDIKSILQQQNDQIASLMERQSDQMARLMEQMSALTADKEKDERIRMLELELEEARS